MKKYCEDPKGLNCNKAFRKKAFSRKAYSKKAAERSKHFSKKHPAKKHTAKRQLRKISIQQKNIQQIGVEHKSIRVIKTVYPLALFQNVKTKEKHLVFTRLFTGNNTPLKFTKNKQ